MLKTFLIMGILGIAAALYVYVFVINKPHPDYRNMDPEYVMLAADLFEQFRNDRQHAEQEYNGRMVQLNGTMDYMEHNDSLIVGVFVFDKGMFGEEGIRCSMISDEHNSKEFSAVNREVRVKGYVAGYNDSDVILENCSFVN